MRSQEDGEPSAAECVSSTCAAQANESQKAFQDCSCCSELLRTESRPESETARLSPARMLAIVGSLSWQPIRLSTRFGASAQNNRHKHKQVSTTQVQHVFARIRGEVLHKLLNRVRSADDGNERSNASKQMKPICTSSVTNQSCCSDSCTESDKNKEAATHWRLVRRRTIQFTENDLLLRSELFGVQSRCCCRR